MDPFIIDAFQSPMRVLAEKQWANKRIVIVIRAK